MLWVHFLVYFSYHTSIEIFEYSLRAPRLTAIIKIQFVWILLILCLILSIIILIFFYCIIFKEFVMASIYFNIKLGGTFQS